MRRALKGAVSCCCPVAVARPLLAFYPILPPPLHNFHRPPLPSLFQPRSSPLPHLFSFPSTSLPFLALHSPPSPSSLPPFPDELIQRLIEDPNAFLRTTQTLGAESASITDVTAEKRHKYLGGGPPNLHAVLWPSLFGVLLLSGTLGYTFCLWRRRRRSRLRNGGLAPMIGDGGRSSSSSFPMHGYSARSVYAAGGADADRSSGGGDGAGGFAAALGTFRRRGWWGNLRAPGRWRAGGGSGGRGGGANGGQRNLELVLADLGGAHENGEGVEGVVVDVVDVDPRASPRDDSFAAILRQKQQQLLADVCARRGGWRGGSGRRGSRGSGGSGSGNGGGLGDLDGRGDGGDGGSNDGAHSEVADSAAELAGR